MNERELVERVAEARRRLLAAARHLRHAQVLAVAGVHYDDVEFDHLALDYRRAMSDLRAARSAWQGWRMGSQPAMDRSAAGAPVAAMPLDRAGAAGTPAARSVADGPVAAAPAVPLEPTARLRFAKWLYEHGRIAG